MHSRFSRGFGRYRVTILEMRVTEMLGTDPEVT